MRLRNRISRSVTLIAASEELQAAILGPFDGIGRAVDVLNRFRDAPMGRVRLSVPTQAAELLVGPVLATYVKRYSDVELGISGSNRTIDVIDVPARALRVAHSAGFGIGRMWNGVAYWCTAGAAGSD